MTDETRSEELRRLLTRCPWTAAKAAKWNKKGKQSAPPPTLLSTQGCTLRLPLHLPASSAVHLVNEFPHVSPAGVFMRRKRTATADLHHSVLFRSEEYYLLIARTLFCICCSCKLSLVLACMNMTVSSKRTLINIETQYFFKRRRLSNFLMEAPLSLRRGPAVAQKVVR